MKMEKAQKGKHLNVIFLLPSTRLFIYFYSFLALASELNSKGCSQCPDGLLVSSSEVHLWKQKAFGPGA